MNYHGISGGFALLMAWNPSGFLLQHRLSIWLFIGAERMGGDGLGAFHNILICDPEFDC